MLIPDYFIDDLKQRLTLSQVIGKKIKLQRKGNYYLGLCPFHQEKTPSFTVSDHKGSYYCFGCHAHGDLIQFVSEVEKLAFSDSVLYLAEIAGMVLPQLAPAEQKKIQHKHSLIDVVTKAGEWFFKQLKLSNNYFAYEYLQKRGVNDSDIEQFSLGYAPPKGLIDFLKQEGIAIDLICECGLAFKTETNNYVERFRNRVIFPIKNKKNQIVGFGGRSLDAEAMPKYLNSPETTIFKKNNLLYALDLAYKHILKSKRVIVVEGYIDTIFMHKAGLYESVAALGTAFNQVHLKNLWSLADEPILCFDGDEAGRKAMLKAAHAALPLLLPGISLRFCFLPKGQDPDEIINLHGASYINNLLENSISLSDFIWNSELEQSALNSPEGKALFEQRILDLVNQIQNQVVRNHYNQFMRNKLWQEFSNTRIYEKKTSKTTVVDLKNSISLSIPSKNISLKDRLEYSLFSQLITYPDLIMDPDIFEPFFLVEIQSKELEKLRSIIIKYHENQELCLNDLLIENNLCNLVKFLCGPESSFIDLISTIDSFKAKQIWLITYKKYLLELVKAEYKQCVEQAYHNDFPFEKVLEFKRNIDILINEITEKENNLSL